MPNGTLDHPDPGGTGTRSQDLVNLVTRAHAAGDRVVLTVTCFDRARWTGSRRIRMRAAKLSAALIAAVQAKSLGRGELRLRRTGECGPGRTDQPGHRGSNALHATDPHWQVSMAVYASAAGDPGGFTDVGRRGSCGGRLF